MTIEAPKVHVHMTVSNLEKSRAFYEKFFGTAPVKVKPGYVKFLPGFGPLNLALSEAAPAESRGHVDHMGIQVESADGPPRPRDSLLAPCYPRSADARPGRHAAAARQSAAAGCRC